MHSGSGETKGVEWSGAEWRAECREYLVASLNLVCFACSSVICLLACGGTREHVRSPEKEKQESGGREVGEARAEQQTKQTNAKAVVREEGDSRAT